MNFTSLLTILSISAFFSVCRVTSFVAKPVERGALFDQLPKDIRPKEYVKLQVVKAADWEVPLSGLLDLKDPRAKEEGIVDRPEPISIYFYVIHHPKYGTYMIDSGVGESFTRGKEELLVSSIVASQMNMDTLKVFETTKTYLEKNKIQLKGIFFTHLHLDHVMGAYELERQVPFYVGPGETSSKQFLNLFVQGSTDALLGEAPDLEELAFGKGPSRGKALDFFGDQSFFVLSVPGHTPGSLAFLVPAKGGSHLVVGDTCHTQWGWAETVPPGDFTQDSAGNRLSLRFLKELATERSVGFVYPGHQDRVVTGK